MERNDTKEQKEKAKKISEQIKLCADQGWKANFVLNSGERMQSLYITAADFDAGAMTVEAIGERHLEPTLLFFKDLAKVEPDWSA